MLFFFFLYLLCTFSLNFFSSFFHYFSSSYHFCLSCVRTLFDLSTISFNMAFYLHFSFLVNFMSFLFNFSSNFFTFFLLMSFIFCCLISVIIISVFQGGGIFSVDKYARFSRKVFEKSSNRLCQ